MEKFAPTNFVNIFENYFYNKYPESINSRINGYNDDNIKILEYLSKNYELMLREATTYKAERYLYKIEDNLYFLMQFEMKEESPFSKAYYGIYSDFLNIKIICTFNSNINKIDKALLRKGRIGSIYKFNKLSIDKTNKLLEHLNIDYVSNEEMSLADIYNLNDKSYNDIKNKIGF
jgi:hypothetical protein